LKIFFGYAAGVGKTFAMLDDAREQMKLGIDVVVGYIGPHIHPESLRLLDGLPSLPPKTIESDNNQLKEFDLDGALSRKPELILIGNLAHTNVPGTRNKKRYQDIEELLNAGIDVYTTVNVENIESLNDIVRDITSVFVKDTIPDRIFDNADKVKLIDIEPDELLKRLSEGRISLPGECRSFFKEENLRALREIALRKAAARISHDNFAESTPNEKAVNTRFLVCINPSPSSAKCIRWTARTAEAFHAPWTVIYVDTPESSNYSDEQKKSINANMELAASLGAQLVNLSGFNVAATVSEYARLVGITNIVIGKNKKGKAFGSLFRTDFEDELFALLPSVDIHIIPENNNGKHYAKTKAANLASNLNFSWRDTLLTFLIITAATLFSIWLNKHGIGDQNVIMTYILSVLIISRITTGYAYGVIASALSVLTFSFFFVEPYFTFHAIQPGYPLTLLIMLLVALIMSALMARIKNQANNAVTREHKTEVLYDINKRLLITRGLEKIIQLLSDYISELFSRSVILYVEDPESGKKGYFRQSSKDPDSSFMLSPDEQAAAHWVFVNKKRAGAGTDTLMNTGAFYMPILSQGNVLGVLGISCANGILLNHDDRSFLRMISSLAAMALERQRLSDKQRGMLVESEKEKMRSNLLRAVSHDLRTPLTGILGASSTILENGETLDRATHDKLISDIREDSQWLIRMVENLLSVTRINEGGMNVNKTPEAAEEIVAEAVGRVRARFKECRISVKVPEKLLIVPMDGTLIEQVIINLLENAVRNSESGSPIQVVVSRNFSYAIFEVIDNGRGISPQDFPYLFQGYNVNRNKSSDSSRGIGIGLSICKSIVKAHNGKIEAENRKSGGAVFRFMLPLNEERKK
jgi:two-component system sensor histidine kinase KdpD